MARRKPNTPAVAITSLEHVDDVLREMAECSRSLEGISADMNAAIDLVKADAKAQAAIPSARLAALEESLAAYATVQRSTLFTTRKSITRVFGSFGFRKSTEIKPQTKQTWATVLEKIKSLKMLQAIRIKEEVNKEVLQEWPDERLDIVGARRVPSDKFWVELDQAALDDSTHAAR